MKKISNQIVFFGNECLATGITTTAPTFNALIKNNFEIVALIINNKNDVLPEVALVADKNEIPIYSPDNLDDIKKLLVESGAVIGVLASYGKIIPEEIINIFPLGIVNIHPSLLPKHRGSTPIESVILDGSEITGVSLMQLVKAMDSGPVYCQDELELNGKETKQELADKLSEIGAELLIKNLENIINKKIKPLAQDENEATYDQQITKIDGAIDWNLRAEKIEKQIRAYQNWPNSRATIMNKDVIIQKAEVIDKTGVPGEVLTLDKQLVVCCGEKAINILTIKPAGKKEMTGQAFISGYIKKSK